MIRLKKCPAQHKIDGIKRENCGEMMEFGAISAGKKVEKRKNNNNLLLP